MSVSKQNSDESSVEENGEAITEDDERLKGDAIGDTLYSESWILKTLMKLTERAMQLNWMNPWKQTCVCCGTCLQIKKLHIVYFSMTFYP
ncbi:Uncharacterized protein APZ42_014930 [Daphnia magna]|uniref:Uncharacterized protein n=1 Tax=Daphnia magna TaxID=35525 RepID=A0A162P0Z6_9CRUS|nr:Uncharacterized protein APZ42_014930 [Daphnia magna]